MNQSPLNFSDFQKVDMRIGTVIEAKENHKARKSAYILKIDFGDKIGIKTSSAQITENYKPQELVGKQICAVMNFSPMRIAGIKSEVLVLAGVCTENGTVLLHPSICIKNGTQVA